MCHFMPFCIIQISTPLISIIPFVFKFDKEFNKWTKVWWNRTLFRMDPMNIIFIKLLLKWWYPTQYLESIVRKTLKLYSSTLLCGFIIISKYVRNIKIIFTKNLSKLSVTKPLTLLLRETNKFRWCLHLWSRFILPTSADCTLVYCTHIQCLPRHWFTCF